MGQPKAALPYRGATVAEALLAALSAGGVVETCVVLAPESPVAALFEGLPGVRTTINPRPQLGMLSSVLAGLEALGGSPRFTGELRPLTVCPVDHPAIEPDTVASLLATVAAGAGIAIPVHEGRRGHPIAIAPALVPRIEGLDLRVGLRQLLELERQNVVEVAVDDAGATLDLDTPADYHRLGR